MTISYACFRSKKFLFSKHLFSHNLHLVGKKLDKQKWFHFRSNSKSWLATRSKSALSLLCKFPQNFGNKGLLLDKSCLVGVPTKKLKLQTLGEKFALYTLAFDPIALFAPYRAHRADFWNPSRLGEIGVKNWNLVKKHSLWNWTNNFQLLTCWSKHWYNTYQDTKGPIEFHVTITACVRL